jgi:hypothetical protein
VAPNDAILCLFVGYSTALYHPKMLFGISLNERINYGPILWSGGVCGRIFYCVFEGICQNFSVDSEEIH